MTFYRIKETRMRYSGVSEDYFGWFDTYDEAYDSLPEDFFQGPLCVTYDVAEINV